MAVSVVVREFDAGRSVKITRITGGMVILEAGDSCYAFDSGIMLHQIKKLFGLAPVVSEASVTGVPEP